MKKWNHGYLGLAMMLHSGLMLWLWNGSQYYAIEFYVGLVLACDELYQVVNQDQYGGLIHMIYIKTLWKIGWVKKFNLWMDDLFSKTPISDDIRIELINKGLLMAFRKNVRIDRAHCISKEFKHEKVESVRIAFAWVETPQGASPWKEVYNNVKRSNRKQEQGEQS